MLYTPKNLHRYKAKRASRKVLYILASIILIFFPCIATAGNGYKAKKYQLKIAKQEVSAALIELGSQLGLSIIIPENATPLGAAGVSGRYTASGAINTLLKGSGFTYNQLGPKIYLIQARPKETESQLITEEEIRTVGYQTGTHIFRSSINLNSPIDQISALELERAGTQSLSDLIKFIPAVSGNSTSTSISNGGDGTTKVTLRGLPANNTLVLVNGQRTSFDGLAGDSVDLNAIPPTIIQQIDIYKDGASAIYGSEAMAGVINITTRTSFDGLKLSQYAGQTSDGHALTLSSDLLWGKEGDKYTALAALSSFSQEGMFGPDRALTASADGRPFGGLDKRSSATGNSRISLDNNTFILRDNVITPTPVIDDFRLATDEDLFDFNQQNSTISPSSRLSAYGFVSAEVRDNLRWHAQLISSTTEATITLASTPFFTAFTEEPITVSKDNIYNPFGVDINDVRRRITELPPRKQQNSATSLHMNSGFIFNNDLSTWRINLYWNQVKAKEQKTNLIDGLKAARALRPSQQCQGLQIDACEPLNLFGSQGSITQSQLDYITAKNENDGRSRLTGLNIDLSSSVIGSAGLLFSYAGGIEIRQESSSLTSPQGGSGSVGSGFRSDTRGERKVYEAYGEILLPIQLKRGWGNSIEFELATRLANSSDYGSNTSPKLGVSYKLNPSFSLKGTYSEGYRAPSIKELYRDGSASYASLFDPCSTEDSPSLYIGCKQRSDPSLNQFLTVYKGDLELDPEISKNYTFGLSFTPQRITGLQLTANFFDIRLRNIINSNPQTLLDENARNGLFSEFITRDSDGNITRIEAPFINIGKRHLQGVDLSLLYSSKQIRWSINASHLRKFEEQLNQFTAIEDLAGTFRDAAEEGNGSLPKWKANMGLSWVRKSFEINYSLNYIDKLVENIERGSIIGKRSIDEWISHNIQLQNQFYLYDLSIGIDNFLNRLPPFAVTAFNNNYDAHAYDIKGRFIYFKIGKQF